MEDLNLTETELRYFGDLFICCDEESNGKVPVLKATELFRSSNIPNDILKQITDLSFPQINSAIITHINRKQFYSALKLIAAHQANMTLRADLLNSFVDLPLPRFTWTLNYETDPDLIQLSTSPNAGIPKEQHIHKRDKSLSSYEPMRLSSNSSDVDVPRGANSLASDHSEAQSTDSEVESETLSQRSDHSHTMRANNGSPWSTGSESPTPTNSVAERAARAAQAAPQHRWPHMGEEHTQLLGTEEESSDRHSSEEEGPEGTGAVAGVWRVGPEQRRHYAVQFQQLQPDARGLLSGSVARHFFEKSRLPVVDLRKIWLLSDVTKDGALCSEEFTTAMHLIVLRRNEIPVPDVLPQCLVPRVRKLSTRTSPGQVITSNLVDLGSDTNINLVGEFNPKKAALPAPPTSKTSVNDIDAFDEKIIKNLNIDDSSPSFSPPIIGEAPLRNKPEPLSGNKEWTKFIDSPTSSIASPGPKPVNFDFHKASVERDPKIFHPVPLRVTPEASSLPIQSSDSGGTSPRKIDDLVYNYQDSHDISSPKKLSNQISGDGINLSSTQSCAAEIKPIQRPQAKKPVLKNIGAIPPPPTKDISNIAEENSGPMSLQYAPKKEPPPPPPPRPLRTHTRSSSLDLNKLKSTHSVTAGIPPQVPPRISPSITSPQSKKLINQRSEGDVLGLLGDPAFDPSDAFGQNPTTHHSHRQSEEPSTEMFANFAQFQNILPLPVAESSAINLPRSRASFEDETVPRKHGAFEIYRKPTPRSSESPDTCALAEPSLVGPSALREDPLKRLQEQNALLCRLCQELSLELADVQRERETLRLRLEAASTTTGV